MGYPMTWKRLVNRNGLTGDYDPGNPPKALISGDMRRLEIDSRDDRYGQEIANAAGVSLDVARRVLNAFFDGTKA